jgi:hypothetical protein
MNMSARDWPYWSVDLPGLSQAQAVEMISAAERAGLPSGGAAIDPREFLTMHLDRRTVEDLHHALTSDLVTLPSASEELSIILGFAEILKEWLDATTD